MTATPSFKRLASGGGPYRHTSPGRTHELENSLESVPPDSAYWCVIDSLPGAIGMDRVHIGALLLFVLLTVGLAAQSPQPAPAAKPMAFEAADIHPSPFSFGGAYFRQAPFTVDRFVVHQ